MQNLINTTNMVGLKIVQGFEVLAKPLMNRRAGDESSQDGTRNSGKLIALVVVIAFVLLFTGIMATQGAKGVGKVNGIFTDFWSIFEGMPTSSK